MRNYFVNFTKNIAINCIKIKISKLSEEFTQFNYPNIDIFREKIDDKAKSFNQMCVCFQPNNFKSICLPLPRHVSHDKFGCQQPRLFIIDLVIHEVY